MSNPQRPHGLQPTRLLHPWDFPGRSTGVGCHCLLPGFPNHHQLPETAQTHIHQVSDTIQPYHPLLSPYLTAFNLSQPQGLFKVFNKSVCIRWPTYWSFSFSISPSNEYSGLIFFRMDWLDLFAVQGTFKSLYTYIYSAGNPSSRGTKSL